MEAPIDEMMVFFTRAWSRGDLSDAECDAASDGYARHFESISHILPSRLAQLARIVSLHDARVLRVVVDNANNVCLTLRAGDFQRGYYDADLRYRGVSLLLASPEVSEIAGNDDFEIIADEIDISEGIHTFEHRLLARRGAIAVRFREFDYTVALVPDRDFVAP